MNRKYLILTILLAGLVLSLGYAWWATPRQQRIAPGQNDDTPAAVAAGGSESDLAPLPHIRFDLLGEEPEPFPGAERDIFNFYVAPARVVASPPPPPPPPAPAPSPPPPPPPRPVVQKPLSSFSFLGFLEVGKETVVFLSSDEKIYLVRKGERFGSNREFEVADISNHVLTVKQTGQADPVKVFLVEKEKSDLSVSSPARLGPLPPVPAEPTEAPQGMSTPARRSPSRASSSPARVRFEGDNMDNLNGSEPQEPSVDTGNPEGEMNGTNQ